MKKVLSLVLVTTLLFTLCFPAFAQNEITGSGEYYNGYLEGKAEGKEYDSSDWMTWGIIGGLLGIPGGLIAVGASAILEPKMEVDEFVSEEKSDQYMVGFKEGYLKEAKNNNLKSSAIGACAGVLITFLLSSLTK